MAQLQHFVIHCTATPEGRHVSVADIEKWHLQERGWSQVGYSDLITLDGSLMNLVPHDTDNEVDATEITNGVWGINAVSRHVAYAGGVTHTGLAKDTRTPRQMATLIDLVRYTIKRHPQIQIAGHNQFDPTKFCPSFDVPEWLRAIRIPEANIYCA